MRTNFMAPPYSSGAMDSRGVPLRARSQSALSSWRWKAAHSSTNAMALLGRYPLRMESVSISKRASYSPYSAWKCAGLWSLKYIRTTIPKNRVTSGISSIDFTPSALAASEAASDRHAARVVSGALLPLPAPQHPQHRVDQHRRHTHRNRDFPPDVHQLIVPVARERAAEPDHHVDDHRDLHQEPEEANHGDVDHGDGHDGADPDQDHHHAKQHLLLHRVFE